MSREVNIGLRYYFIYYDFEGYLGIAVPLLPNNWMGFIIFILSVFFQGKLRRNSSLLPNLEAS